MADEKNNIATDEQIKLNFSRNISNLRKSRKLTQLQFATKINYSDKSVSKWECGDVVPDIVTLTSIAKFFSITVDQLIGPELGSKVLKKRKHILITGLSAILTLFIATFVSFILFSIEAEAAWMPYIYFFPVVSIVLIVFSRLWFSIPARCVSVSLLDWGLGLSLYVSLLVFAQLNIWFVFIVCLVFQILVLLWFILVKARHG